jgi:ParB family chromosome partitioning protein
VSVQSGSGLGGYDREQIAAGITEGGVLSSDQDLVRTAARSMLAAVLSCRDNMTNSGVVARIAGDAIGASLNLPNMATEEFLSCLSKAAIGKAATAEGVRIELRAKDTRARVDVDAILEPFDQPGALFKLTQAEIDDAKETAARRYVPSSRTWDSDDDPTDGLDDTMEGGEAAEGDEVPLRRGHDFADADASAMAAGD